MYLPNTLTPLSRTVVLDGLAAAQRRLAQALALPPTFGSESGPDSDRRFLALAAHAGWEASIAAASRLLGFEQALVASPARSGAGPRLGQELLTAADSELRRLRGWADRVFAMPWTQAQLLQVMEEIEPRVIDAFYLERGLALTALGGYVRLIEQLLKQNAGQAESLRLDLVGGLESPGGRMAADLAAGLAPAAWVAKYGYRGENEMELASPRLTEAPPVWSEPAGPAAAWQPAAAEQRRQAATQVVIAQAGLLSRGKTRTLIEQVQAALAAQAEAEDALAYVLAATRRWALAAAGEALKDGRLLDAGEIFRLELEEIKQMMTGEWHSRSHVQPLLAERWGAERMATPASSLAPSAPDQGERLQSPADIATLSFGGHALTPPLTPAWTLLFLRASLITSPDDHFLSFGGSVARSGGVNMWAGSAARQVGGMVGGMQQASLIDDGR